MARIAHAHHTGLTVSSFDRSVEFYRDMLGLELVATQEQEGATSARSSATRTHA